MQGLKDCGHIILSCSSCGKNLVDIWKIKENKEWSWKVMAKCCYCGDNSYIKEFTGQFARGGYSINPDKNKDPEEPNAKMLTSIVKEEERDDGVIVFHTKKANL